MSTVQTLIDSVNLPGDIPDSIKYRWLGELNGVQYRYPNDANTELRYEDEICETYLIAMNDFFTGDLEAYSVSATNFQMALAKRRRLINVTQKIHDTK